MATPRLARWLLGPWCWILLPVLTLKLALAWAMPLTGDEAYFVLWGRHLDVGYYDHPPMAGWLTWLAMQLSEHRVVIRLPGLLSEFIIAGAFYAFMRPWHALKARSLTLLFLLSPLSLFFVFTLTDTGCMVFSALSFFAAAQGLLSTRRYWYVLAGLALGLAFLSKYFAVFLVLAYVYFFFIGQPQRWRQGLLLLLMAVPAVCINVYWNQQHCWANLVFNLVNRHQGSHWQVTTLLGYVLLLAYVLLPPVLMGLWRVRRLAVKSAATDSIQRVLPMAQNVAHSAVQNVVHSPVQALALCTVLTAVFGFLLISIGKNIGLHWLLWFYPMALLLLWPLAVPELHKIVEQVAWISLAHALLFAMVLALPLSAWRGLPSMSWSILAMREAPAILAQARLQAATIIGAKAATVVLATQGYTSASVLSYQIKQPVIVIGIGSKYARQDDFWTDYRRLAGEDVLVLLKRSSEAAEVAQWFTHSQRISVQYRGQRFEFLVGEGFNYPRYRDQVLRVIQAQFYVLPSWLPACQCAFTERYFLASAPSTVTSRQK